MTHDGGKFVWDGCQYANEEEALEAMARYGQERFVVRLEVEAGSFFVYTRRAVKESAVTTQ
jgi:hypothetical protein